MTLRRVDQDMAREAAQVVPAVVDKELRTRYRQLRVMLHSAGLAATYAFIASKAGDEDDLARAYRAVGSAIRGRLAGLIGDDIRQANASGVLGKLGNIGSAEYTRASADVSAFVGWLSRLGDALYQERGGDA
jgi:CRISPR/Cas system CMR-associated protein Cmr5 small subunit